MAAGDIALSTNGKVFPLQNVANRIILQDNSLAGTVLTSGYASYTGYATGAGQVSFKTATHFFEYLNSGGTTGAVVKKPIITTAASGTDVAFTFTTYASGGGLKQVSSALGVVAYQTGNGSGAAQAFNLNTMTAVGGTVPLGGGNGTNGYDIVPFTYGGNPAVAIVDSQTAGSVRVRACAITDGGGLGASLWGSTACFGYKPSDLLPTIDVAPDNSALVVHNYDSYAVINPATGALIGSAGTISQQIQSANKWRIPQADGVLFLGGTSSAMYRFKIKYDGTIGTNATAIGVSCDGSQGQAGFAVYQGATKLYLATSGVTANTVQVSELNLTDFTLINTYTITTTGSVGSNRTYACHLAVDETENIAYLVYTGYNGTAYATHAAVLDAAAGYATLRTSPSLGTNAPQGSNSYRSCDLHPIGGLSFTYACVRTSGPRHIAPPGRAPLGVVLKAASAGQQVLLLKSGQAQITASNFQSGTATYDGTTNTPVGVRLTLTDGLATM
jgi:hypothetical protein